MLSDQKEWRFALRIRQQTICINQELISELVIRETYIDCVLSG